MDCCAKTGTGRGTELGCCCCSRKTVECSPVRVLSLLATRTSQPNPHLYASLARCRRHCMAARPPALLPSAPRSRCAHLHRLPVGDGGAAVGARPPAAALRAHPRQHLGAVSGFNEGSLGWEVRQLTALAMAACRSGCAAAPSSLACAMPARPLARDLHSLTQPSLCLALHCLPSPGPTTPACL